MSRYIKAMAKCLRLANFIFPLLVACNLGGLVVYAFNDESRRITPNCKQAVSALINMQVF